MTSFGRRIIEAIDEYRYHVFVAAALLLGLMLRWVGRDFVSFDMGGSLLPWFELIKQRGGLEALGAQVGNYGLFYQTLISLMTYIEILAVFQYKLLSDLFDVALAVLAAALYRDMKTGGNASQMTRVIKCRSWCVAAAVWLLPTVILNSSYWGQCDSMYTFFALSAIYMLRRERVIAAFALLGLALGCKLQTVFFLPFIGVWYLVSKRFSAANVLITLAVMWLTGIVAFAYGRSLLEPIMIYFRQSMLFGQMYLGFPSFWMMLGDGYAVFGWLAILVTLSVLVVGAYVCLCNRDFLNVRANYYPVLIWFVWTMVLFLPCMHDRYAYPLDILLLLLACLNRRYIKYALVALFASVYFYCDYLFVQRNEEPLLLAAVYVVAYLHYTFSLYRQVAGFARHPSNAEIHDVATKNGHLTSIEGCLVDFIIARRHVLLVLSLIFIGVMMRWSGRGFLSSDMLLNFMPWFDQIKEAGGLPSLAGQVGNYGLLYQTIISLMTYIDISSAHLYKMLSAVFDVGLAVMAALIYRDFRKSADSAGRLHEESGSSLLQSCFVGCAVWLLPTVIINSSFWGQCDSIYTFFCLATLYSLRRGAVIRAFVMLGLAFSCKLQALFFLPFIITYYLASRRFSALNVLISVLVVWLTCIVAFAYGRSLLEPITIYCNQLIDCKQMYMNFSSAWVILGNDYAGLKWYSILFTLFAVVAGAYVCLNNKRFLDRADGYFSVATWFVWTMVLFLPCMQDRYAYPLDVMLVLLACMNWRFVKFAVLSVAISLYHYGFTLIEHRMSEPILMAVVYLLAYLYYSWILYAQIKKSGQPTGLE